MHALLDGRLDNEFVDDGRLVLADAVNSADGLKFLCRVQDGLDEEDVRG